MLPRTRIPWAGIRMQRCSQYRTQSSQVYDFRSDTVTRPTQAMMEYAMRTASQGDDVFGEDESSRALEAFMADLTGHEAALFCVSGTMSNQLALRTWLRGALQSVLLDSRSHIFKYENAGIAFHSQAGTTPVSPEPGLTHLTVDRLARRLQHSDLHVAETRVVCLENTLNGNIFPLQPLQDIGRWTRSKNLILHLDGARLWNASAATGIALRDYCTLFDSVSLCLSKGIGAPIGSILVGPRDFIREARHFRKLLGGGWRQAGLLACMAHYAIQHHFLTADSGTARSRLAVDHDNARWLANELRSRFPGVRILNEPVETNMLFCDIRSLSHASPILPDAAAAAPDTMMTVERLVDGVHQVTGDRLKLPRWGYPFDTEDGPWSLDEDRYVMRLVLHHQVDRVACELLLSSLERVRDRAL